METIRIRRATKADCELLFHWKNDPVTLANSFQSEPVSLDVHTTWLQRTLHNPNVMLLIGETPEGIPLGQLRFDTENDRAVVGITVSPEYRGKKIGSSLLSSGCAYYRMHYPSIPVDAFIKPSNIASGKVFAASGFDFMQDTFVKGQEAIRMTLHP